MVKVSLLLLVAALAFVQARNTYHRVGNRKVVFRQIDASYFDADLSCKREGKRLFAPRNEEEINDAHKLMTSLLRNGNHVWVGFLNLHLSSWSNLNTAEPFNRFWWSKGIHGNDETQNCMFMTKQNGHSPPELMSEADCSGKMPYFCEPCELD